jgi:DNA-binding transcriptional LysR family regulator
MRHAGRAADASCVTPSADSHRMRQFVMPRLELLRNA